HASHQFCRILQTTDREGERNTCLVERGGNLRRVLTHARHANGSVDLTAAAATASTASAATASGLEIHRHDHTRFRNFEILDHVGSLGPANDDGIEVEFLGEGESPDDLTLFAGIERDAHP